MEYTVVVKKKVSKNIPKLPPPYIQKKFIQLVKDLKDKGARQPGWPNYSKLENDKYHCHLNPEWVACWQWEKNTIIIEVYYAGSRENAPY
jgi:mRNA-degrading endonuclease RelE of RelBE toxin-antitoxin system